MAAMLPDVVETRRMKLDDLSVDVGAGWGDLDNDRVEELKDLCSSWANTVRPRSEFRAYSSTTTTKQPSAMISKTKKVSAFDIMIPPSGNAGAKLTQNISNLL